MTADLPFYAQSWFWPAAGFFVAAILAAFAFARSRSLATRLEETEAAAEAIDSELKGERERRVIAEERMSRLPVLESQIEALRSDLAIAQQRGATLTAEIAKERQAAEEKLAAVNEAQARLIETFKALSLDALKDNNKHFLEQARLTLEQVTAGAKTELAAREKAISDLLSPVKEALGKVDTQMREMESVRAGAYGELKQVVAAMSVQQEQLRGETRNLVTALRKPQARGRWGEIQLKRVVEMAGMLDHCDFEEQHSVTDGEGRMLRPDMIVRLPGGKTMVVDAKTPLDGYLDAVAEGVDEAGREAALARHVRHVREHMRQLGQKAYWNQFEHSPEFVVLFLPGEAFFAAALEQDGSLIEEGVANRVILATPTTLIALLRAVHYGWRQERLAENARDISELGKTLYERIAVFGSHMAKMGTALSRATESYNSAVGSLERNVMTTARQLKDLHVASDKEVEALNPVEVQPRSLQKLETGEEALLP
jgi:DNA recombination protein RmuC